MPDERGHPRTWGKQALVGEVIALREVLRQQMTAAPGIGPEVVVEGIVSHRTGEPIVRMRAGEAAWDFDTTKAREHALAVLERAVEAERDAATIAAMRHVALSDGDSEEEADRYGSGILALIRDHRAQVTHRVTVETVAPNAFDTPTGDEET